MTYPFADSVPERTPTKAEVVAYSDCLFQMMELCQDAFERGESQEVIHERFRAALTGLDWPSIHVVDKYLSEVEDGSRIRPVRRDVLARVLTRLFVSDDDER